jgi:HlyD family secretion protein
MTVFHGLRLSLLAFAIVLAGCGNSNNQSYQGWIEADLIFVSPDESGRIETLAVREGEEVAVGAALFAVDDELQQADLKVAEATLANAKQTFERAQQLLKTGAGTQKSFDDAQATLREADAKANAARTRLVRRRLISPVTGAVQQVYYRQGEVVPAGRPVIALLPPGNVKVRFYVPQAVLPKISIGDRVSVQCDGCGDNLSARASFIARSAEFTPPVIYSLEERSKLVFLIEARPERPETLRVGQPVSVTLAPETRP